MVSLRADASNLLVWPTMNWKRPEEVIELQEALRRPPPVPSPPPAPREVQQLKEAKKEGAGSNVIGYAASIGGVLVGIGLAKAFGSIFWWPAGLVAGAWVILKK